MLVKLITKQHLVSNQINIRNIDPGVSILKFTALNKVHYLRYMKLYSVVFRYKRAINYLVAKSKRNTRDAGLKRESIAEFFSETVNAIPIKKHIFI